MKFLRYKLIPTSPLGSALQSDTLAGHLLCFAGELEGEDALENLIAQFVEGNPPFILSSAFPEGLLPFPAVPWFGRKSLRERLQKDPKLFGEKVYSKTALFNVLKKLKKFKKNSYIPIETWKKLKDGFDLESLFLELADRQDAHSGKKTETPHNVIDRTTGRVAEEGGLFFTAETFFDDAFRFDLYAKVRPDFLETFESLMEQMEKEGYGRDRSVGRGMFEIVRDTNFDPYDIENPEGNYLLNLSVFSTTEMRAWDGTYALMTKYGKVWNGFGETNPFKKPFLAFKEGAVFKKREIDLGTCVLRNIHSNKDIIQCTLPLMVPFCWEV